MFKKGIISIFLIIITSQVIAKNTITAKNALQEKRWEKILRLVNEEIKTISKVKTKSQKLEYRMFELMSEKVKLFKEKENKQFVKKKLKYGKKITRKQIFKKTLSLYNQANSFGKSLLRKYPNSRYKAAIYYTLALNSRDFSYDKNELKFLRLALDNSTTRQQVNYLARTSLAEYYYNIKNWKSAIYQYDQVLSNKDDEWYTKNLLNYGWCKLKNQQFKTAIHSLEKSFKLSQTDFYVDVQEQAMNGLVSFYVLGKDINRGISFIEKNAKKKNDYLLRLAKKASGKGFFKEANQIVVSLEKSINKETKQELYTDLKLFQFEMYNQYQKSNLLLKTAKEFKKLTFSKYQNEDAVLKLSQVVGAKQVILKKDYSKYNKEYNKKALTEVIEYFNILSKINKKKSHEYSYFQAETYYSVELFEKAVSKYKNSLTLQPMNFKKKNIVDLREKNLDAIFSCIDLIDYKDSKLKKDNELEFAYVTYIKFWPKSIKAQKIYPRLFNLHARTKDFKSMGKSLRLYAKNFPKDVTIQQNLFRSQLDIMIKDKNTDLLSKKISIMAKGFLKFKKSEVKKSETILANILFSKFQQLRKSGDNHKALEGYKRVFYRDGYPRSIRGEAAFNMGMIYTDIENNSDAFKWYRKSFKFLNKKEITQKRVFLEKMALRTALLHNFINAAKLERFIVHSFCNDKVSNLKNLNNAIKNDLANDYTTRALYTYEKYKKCVPKISNATSEMVLDHLFQQKHETKFLSFVKKNKLHLDFPEKIHSYYERLYWKYYNTSASKKNRYYNLLSRSNSKQGVLLKNSFIELQALKNSISTFQSKKINIPNKDPNPNLFISQLTKRINELKEVSAKANNVFKLGHGQISVFAYDELIKVSNDFAKEVKNYYLPINDKNFQKQFNNEMDKISLSMKNEAKNLKQSSQKMIEDFELLLVQRKYSDNAYEILSVSDIRTPASTFGVTIGLERDE